MPTFLHQANAMDRCRCDLCGRIYPKALIHEHHVVKRASGGQDTRANIICLDASCHSAVHQVEMALKNQNRRGTAADLVATLFPHSTDAQRRCMELAATAALGVDPSEASSSAPDYSMFNAKELVYLTAPRVSPKVRELVNRVTCEIKNPKTGRKLGVSDYIRGLIEADLKKRGYTFD
jgi:hypothetical protein